MEAFGRLAWAVVLGVVTSFYWGWALMTLWGWFAVAASGFPAVSYAAWVGVSFLWSQLNIMSVVIKKKDLEEADDGVGWTTLMAVVKIVFSLLALGAAGIVFLLLV